MVLPQVLEGTWEEIKRYEPELIGQHVRVYINPDQTAPALPLPAAAQETPKRKPQLKKLQGLGLYAHIPGGSEEFALEKQKEIEREDRKFK